MILMLFIIYALLSMLYIKIFKSDSREETILKVIIVLTMPFIGFLFLLITGQFGNKTRAWEYSKIDHSDYGEHNKSVIMPDTSNYEKEINVVPVEEALIINENSVKRVLIIDILKEDAEKYIGILQKALTDEDTETSHYAATAIAQIRQQFNTAIQDLNEKYWQDKTNVEIMIRYSDVLKKYLDSGLLDSKSYQNKLVVYSEVLGKLIENHTPKEKYFVYKINCELDMGNTKEASLYCRKFKDVYPSSENVYLSYLKLFYNTHSYKSIVDLIHKLKNSPVKISGDLLKSVRFWS